VRDWVVRLNARGADGLINGKAPGKPSLLNEDQRTALAQAIERGPTPYLDGVVRWRLCDLAQWIWEEFRVSVSEETLGREVRSMGYRKLSARPRHHAQHAEAAEAFKKTSPPPWQRSPELNPVENIWQFMRDNWLFDRVFKSYEDIVDHCCYAWRTLQERPWNIMSIGRRQWAQGF